MSAENAWRIAMERCASIAQNACLVPPDGGSPSEEERVMCALAAEYIMAAPMPPAFRAEVEAEAEELRGMLARCVAAMGGGARYEDDIADMLEYGEALEEARALLSRLEAKGESQ